MAAVRSEAVQMDHWKTIVPIVPVHSAETEAAVRSEPSEVLAEVDSEIVIAVDSEAVLPQTADHPMASPLVLLLLAAVRLAENVAAVLSEAEVARIPACEAHSAAEATSVEEDKFNLRK